MENDDSSLENDDFCATEGMPAGSCMTKRSIGSIRPIGSIRSIRSIRSIGRVFCIGARTIRATPRAAHFGRFTTPGIGRTARSATGSALTSRVNMAPRRHGDRPASDRPDGRHRPAREGGWVLAAGGSERGASNVAVPAGLSFRGTGSREWWEGRAVMDCTRSSHLTPQPARVQSPSSIRLTTTHMKSAVCTRRPPSGGPQRLGNPPSRPEQPCTCI